jgi:hypothetical protein
MKGITTAIIAGVLALGPGWPAPASSSQEADPPA